MQKTRKQFVLPITVPPNIEYFQLRQYIASRVREVEGKCRSSHGYILRDSAEVLTVGEGIVPLKQFAGDWVFHVTVKATAVSLAPGARLECRVLDEVQGDNEHLCEAVWRDGDHSPVLLFVQGKPALEPGELVHLDITQVRFHNGDRHIVAVGKLCVPDGQKEEAA
jgi:hypothetical protein